MTTWTITQYLYENTKLVATPRVKTCVSKILKESPVRRQGSTSWQLAAAGAYQAPGDGLRQKIIQVKRKFVFIQTLMEKSTLGCSTILQRISSRRARRSATFTIKSWTVRVQDVVNILPIFLMSRSTLRCGVNLRTTAYGLHLGLQRIGKTSKWWRWIKASQGCKIWYRPTGENTARTQRRIQRADIAGLEHISMVKNYADEWSSSKFDQDESSLVSQILHCALESRIKIHSRIGQCFRRTYGPNMDLSTHSIWHHEKCTSFGTCCEVILLMTSRGMFRNTWTGKLRKPLMRGCKICLRSTTLNGQRKAMQKLCLHNANEVAACHGALSVPRQIRGGTEIPTKLRENSISSHRKWLTFSSVALYHPTFSSDRAISLGQLRKGGRHYPFQRTVDNKKILKQSSLYLQSNVPVVWDYLTRYSHQEEWKTKSRSSSNPSSWYWLLRNNRKCQTSKMANEYNAALKTTYRSLSLVYRQVPQAQLHQHLRHLYWRKP